MRARFYDFGREELGRVSTRPVHKGCDGQLRIVPTNELEIGHSGFILADSVPPTVGDWRLRGPIPIAVTIANPSGFLRLTHPRWS